MTAFFTHKEKLKISRYNVRAVSAELCFLRTHDYPVFRLREMETLMGQCLDELWEDQHHEHN